MSAEIRRPDHQDRVAIAKALAQKGREIAATAGRRAVKAGASVGRAAARHNRTLIGHAYKSPQHVWNRTFGALNHGVETFFEHGHKHMKTSVDAGKSVPYVGSALNAGARVAAPFAAIGRGLIAGTVATGNKVVMGEKMHETVARHAANNAARADKRMGQKIVKHRFSPF